MAGDEAAGAAGDSRESDEGPRSGTPRRAQRSYRPEVGPRGFGRTLRTLRVRAGISLNELARRAGIDPAYVHRIEVGQAGREAIPRRPVVVEIAGALSLDPSQSDDLLARAGYCPETVAQLGGWDHTLHDVGRVLLSRQLEPTAKAEFREVVRILAERWLAAETADG